MHSQCSPTLNLLFYYSWLSSFVSVSHEVSSIGRVGIPFGKLGDDVTRGGDDTLGLINVGAEQTVVQQGAVVYIHVRFFIDHLTTTQRNTQTYQVSSHVKSNFKFAQPQFKMQ